MGRSVLTASQLAAWYSRSSTAHAEIPAFGGHPAGDVEALAQVFIDAGNAEGVRGDIAFVQSMIETGWIAFAGSQVPADAFNYAGIYAFDGRAYVGAPGPETCAHGDSVPSRCMGTPQHGVLMQIQLLRSYADSRTATMPGRLVSAPPDRVGAAMYWEYFGGNDCPCHKLIWAAADGYGNLVVRLYNQAIADSRTTHRSCVPTDAVRTTPSSGTALWVVTADAAVHTQGHAQFYGDPHTSRLAAPITSGDVVSNGTGYWLAASDGGVFAYGAARFFGSTGGFRLNQPVTAMRRAGDDHGYWLVARDGGVFAFGDARYYGSLGRTHLREPIVGMERTATGAGYWLFASDGNVYPFGDAKDLGSPAHMHVHQTFVSMQRTATGNGYWLMTAAAEVFAFGDANQLGDLRDCTNPDSGASHMVTSPDVNGYWIIAGDGILVPFGDATPLATTTPLERRPIVLLGIQPSTFSYTAHYTPTQYALLLKTAAHFHLSPTDTLKAGVAVIATATHTRGARHRAPVGSVPNNGRDLVTATYDPGDNLNTLTPVERYLATSGDNTVYVAGLLMDYIAIVQGMRVGR